MPLMTLLMIQARHPCPQGKATTFVVLWQICQNLNIRRAYVSISSVFFTESLFGALVLRRHFATMCETVWIFKITVLGVMENNWRLRFTRPEIVCIILCRICSNDIYSESNLGQWSTHSQQKLVIFNQLSSQFCCHTLCIVWYIRVRGASLNFVSWWFMSITTLLSKGLQISNLVVDTWCKFHHSSSGPASKVDHFRAWKLSTRFEFRWMNSQTLFFLFTE